MHQDNIEHLANSFQSAKPFPYIELDNFLSDTTATELDNECRTIEQQHWTEFTRNNSYMQECKNLEVAPHARKLVEKLHSSETLSWLEELSGIRGIIPDPHLVGAGYSRSFTGDSLKAHVDFNWNDRLKLHRVLSLVVYITPDWNEEWGGALDLYDENKDTVIHSIKYTFNKCVIWKYGPVGYHGYNSPLTCPQGMSRNAFRLFYYVSNAEPSLIDPPHRSLYWHDKETNKPYDIRTEK